MRLSWGMIKKDFDGWIEFVEKVVKADKEETARLYLERTQLWVDKLQKNLEIMPSGDIFSRIRYRAKETRTVRRHIAMLLEDRILETEHPGDSRAYRIKDTKIVMVKEKKTNGNDNSK